MPSSHAVDEPAATSQLTVGARGKTGLVNAARL